MFGGYILPKVMPNYCLRIFVSEAKKLPRNNSSPGVIHRVCHTYRIAHLRASRAPGTLSNTSRRRPFPKKHSKLQSNKLCNFNAKF